MRLNCGVLFVTCVHKFAPSIKGNARVIKGKSWRFAIFLDKNA